MTAIDFDTAMHRQGWKRNASLNGRDLTNFKTYGSNALEKRLEFAKGYDGGCVFLHGLPGRGKTHLARGIMRAWLEKNGEYSAIYWPLMQLLGELRSRMNGEKDQGPDEYIDDICNRDGLVIIDELGRSKGNDWDRDVVVYQLLDRRQHLPTIFISNYSLDVLANIYDEAISSRLSGFRVIPFPETISDHRARRE